MNLINGWNWQLQATMKKTSSKAKDMKDVYRQGGIVVVK